MTTNGIQEYIHREKPAAAYLGRVEMTEMKHRATLAGWVEPMIFQPDLARLEYAGCPLYQVDAEHHVGFGQNDKVQELSWGK